MLDDGDFDLLRQIPIFSGLSDDSLTAITGISHVTDCPRGALLFQQGDPADRFFVIFSGWVKLFRERPDGTQSVIGIFTHGDSFAEAAILDSGVYPVCAEVVSDARLFSVPADLFLSRLRDNSELAIRMLAALSRHMHQLVEHIEQLSGRSTAIRLAVFLLKLCAGRSERCIVHLPFDKSLLAARLGMQPETLSRAFGKLRAVGVENLGADIVINDPAALLRYSDGDENVGQNLHILRLHGCAPPVEKKKTPVRA